MAANAAACACARRALKGGGPAGDGETVAVTVEAGCCCCCPSAARPAVVSEIDELDIIAAAVGVTVVAVGTNDDNGEAEGACEYDGDHSGHCKL